MRDEDLSRSSGFEEVRGRTQSTGMERSGGSTADLVCKISSIVNSCSDRNKLSERIRDTLLETRGYFDAKIFFSDEIVYYVDSSSQIVNHSYDYSPTKNLPACARDFLKSDKLLSIASACKEHDCPLKSSNLENEHRFSFILETKEKTYGVLCVNTLDHLAMDSEKFQLLKWISSETAYALQRIEREDYLKTAKQELQKSKKSLRNLFSENLAIMIVLDPVTRRFLNANDAALNFYGWDKETLLSKRIEDVNLNPLEELKKEMKRAYSSEKIKFNFQHRLADVSIKDVEVFSKKIELNGRYLMLSIVHDVTEQKRAERELQRTLDEMKKITLSVISALEATMNLRDPYTAGHQIRVTELATAIAERLSLEEDRKNALCFASMIHDVGKIRIPAEILNKPGQLNRLEFEMIKEHPLIGRNLFTKVDLKAPISEIIYQHHERLDDSGYPLGIKGDEILLEARILAVADVVEAMSSHRPYRHSLGTEAALEEISRKRAILYDSDVVSACTEVFEEGFEFPPEAASKNFGL